MEVAMGEKALARIEHSLREIGSAVAALEKRIAALESAERPCSREEIVQFVDQFRAGESLGAELFGSWAAATRDAALRGGLRVIQLREAGHARLLEERLKELGGSPKFRYPDDVLPHELYGSTEKSDGEKLRTFLGLVSPERALADLDRTVARLCGDPETQNLIRAITCDERATLECLQRECELRSA
jgi:hypothetical protein